MDDTDIIRHIGRLIDEEHQLRRCTAAPSEPAQDARLATVEGALDQCWDLLRQRRALRRVAQPPDSAIARSIPTVKAYIQ